jgi:hypothetical protein
MIYAKISQIDKETFSCECFGNSSAINAEDFEWELEKGIHVNSIGYLHNCLAEKGFIPVSETLFYKP